MLLFTWLLTESLSILCFLLVFMYYCVVNVNVLNCMAAQCVCTYILYNMHAQYVWDITLHNTVTYLLYAPHCIHIYICYNCFQSVLCSHWYLSSPLMAKLSFYYRFCVVPVHMLFGTWPCWLYVEYLQVCTSFTSHFLPPPLALSLCVCVCVHVCPCVCVCVCVCLLVCMCM